MFFLNKVEKLLILHSELFEAVKVSKSSFASIS
jgi:hypothetical protein